MYKILFLAAVLFPFLTIALMDDADYQNTRRISSMNRRLSRTNRTSLARKSLYIKEAIAGVRQQDKPLDMGTVGYEMSRLEPKYRLPYDWGGDIRDFQKGLDCTGFVHGMMYYLGYNDYLRRFNTYSLYKKLLRDGDYKLIYKSTISSIADFDLSRLQVGDIVMWPSGVRDAKNLPGDTTFGHIGVVSTIIDGKPHITHFVRSTAYNDIDIFDYKGPGINTLDAYTFITLKQRGVLHIFRKN